MFAPQLPCGILPHSAWQTNSIQSEQAFPYDRDHRVLTLNLVTKSWGLLFEFDQQRFIGVILARNTETTAGFEKHRRDQERLKTAIASQRQQIHSDSSTHRKPKEKARISFNCSAGLILYGAGQKGSAWRVMSGSVRLDRQLSGGESDFASLAIRGDIIGAETMLFGTYSFTATALTPCMLTPWPEGDAAPVQATEVLEKLIATEQRAAEVIALRCGQATERVKRLIMLLASPGNGSKKSKRKPDQLNHQVTLPPRQDMADITALTVETVSRMVSGFRRNGMLNPLSDNCFSLTLLAPESFASRKSS